MTSAENKKSEVGTAAQNADGVKYTQMNTYVLAESRYSFERAKSNRSTHCEINHIL